MGFGVCYAPQGVSSGFGCQVAESEMVSVQVIRDGVWEGKSDKQIYDKLTTEYGELIHYSPAFDAPNGGTLARPGKATLNIPCF